MTGILIKNGLIVTVTDQYKADIRITGEEITEIGLNLIITENDHRVIDADGFSILPGGIDPHVHLTLPDYVPELYRWADDFESGSKAALAGGITTLGCISVPEPDETPLGTLNRETMVAQQEAIADIMIHPVIRTPTDDTIQELPQLVERGCTTIKIFMSSALFEEFSLEYLKTIQAAKHAGMLAMIHCEDYAIISATCDTLIEEGRTALTNYADSRPIVSEVVATQRAVAMCEATGTPLYVVHLSSERALKVCEEAQARSLPVYVEGRPIFLYLTREKYLEPEGALYVIQPPLRETSDVTALWDGIRNKSIHTLATDHAPHVREYKFDPSLSITNLLPGINELQVMLPMFYSRGVLEGKISLQRFVSLTSTNASKLFGLYPRKGTIQVGSDADLVLWDFTEEQEIVNSEMFSKAGFSIYEGTKTTGWPQMTIRRGEVVYEGRRIIALPGSGQVLHRGSPQVIK